MLIKLLVSVFERARSKLTSTRSIDRTLTDSSENELDSQQMFSSRPSIIHQQQSPPRLSISKWLCTSPPTMNKSILSSSSSKSAKVRRSSSWRSLKERGTNYIEHLTSRTLSVDELHQPAKHHQKNNSLRKHQCHRRRHLSQSPIIHLTLQRQKSSGCHSTRLETCDASRSLSANAKHFDRLSSTLVNYSIQDKQINLSTKSHRQTKQPVFSRNNTNSGGGDSGYSEDSFATTTFSSHTRRSLHTSCPHCHCEQRSSFHNYHPSIENSSTDSSTSDTTINKDIYSSDFYRRLLQQKQALSASRSYPHIKPLPKTPNQSQQKRPRTLAAKRRRHLSCDSSLYPRTQTYQPINMTSSPVIFTSNSSPLQRHFTAIGMFTSDSSVPHSNKPLTALPKNTQVFGELNLAAIELDSLRTFDYHRGSFSSSYSSSSSSSINTDKQLSNTRKGTYLVWHEYKNPSLLSTTNGTKIFSVTRGDQVRLLRRIGKSTLLVQKDDDGSIGFLPQSCLAHDQINSFLSVKGLRETVL